MSTEFKLFITLCLLAITFFGCAGWVYQNHKQLASRLANTGASMIALAMLNLIWAVWSLG